MTCSKFQSGSYIDKFGKQEEIVCPSFNKTKMGTPFNMRRPSFLAGTNISGMVKADKIDNINKRSGTGNREIIRQSFETSPIRPRNAIDFDKLQALDIETQGAKIQLSDKTIQEIFKTKVPDPQDTKWLAEKVRMTGVLQAQGMTPEQIERELQVNKPLGREQRKIISKQNIGQSSLSTSDKLKELEQEIKDGRAENRTQQAFITGQIALILADTNAISQLTTTELQGLRTSLATLGVPTNHKALGLIPRFVDIDYYNGHAGMINLLFFSKVREEVTTNQYNYDLIVKNFARFPATGLPAITLRSMVTFISSGHRRRYLDLHRGGVISLGQMRTAVALEGGFTSNEVSIAPANR